MEEYVAHPALRGADGSGIDLSSDWQSSTTLPDALSVMLEHDIATDVTFTFPDSQEKVTSHRVVLMCRSRVFYDMLSKNNNQPNGHIEIDDIAPALFKQFIRFLYREELMITGENVLHVMYCGQKYEVEELKSRCRVFLRDKVNQYNAGLILDQAVFYKQLKLSRTCLDFISRSATLDSLHDHHVSHDTLQAIVECETLAVSQISLFKTCMDWAHHECELRALEPTKLNKRRVLGAIVKKIRYTSMTSKDFAAEVSGQGMLSPSEELEVFRFLNDPPKPSLPSPTKEKTAVCAKLPVDLIGTYDESNPGFQIYITCEREFKLLGFIFNQEGSFVIRLNDDVCEEFYVRADDVKTIMHLSQPVACDTKRGLDIRSQKHRYAFRDKRAKTYSFSTRVSNMEEDTVTFWFKPYVCWPPPFNTLIFAM